MILQTLPLSGCYGKQNVFSFFVNPVIVLVFCLFLKKETNKKTSFMFSGICGNTIKAFFCSEILSVQFVILGRQLKYLYVFFYEHIRLMLGKCLCFSGDVLTIKYAIRYHYENCVNIKPQ